MTARVILVSRIGAPFVKGTPVASAVALFDMRGTGTLTAGMLVAVYTVVSAPMRGWLEPVTLVGPALAAALTSAVRAGVVRPCALCRLAVWLSRP